MSKINILLLLRSEVALDQAMQMLSILLVKARVVCVQLDAMPIGYFICLGGLEIVP